jgi:hypothetical protein
MADIVKHVGIYGQKKCVVVFREVPEESDQCLIVLSDGLEGRMHDELMAIVEGIEAQTAKDLADVLNRRQFSDGTNMLTQLHYAKRLTKVSTDMVDLTPLPGQRIGLAQLNDELRKIDTGYVPPTNDLSNETDLLESAKNKPWSERTADEASAYNQNQTRSASDIATEAGRDNGVSLNIGEDAPAPPAQEAIEPSAAQGLLIQASMMKEDAERLLAEASQKEQQAYDADPSLKPKRGRGRPKKSESA